jgi:predicted PurR-regulated permease PerM
MPSERPSASLFGLAALAIVAAALFFGRDLFVPLALSILLSFLLGPIVARLHRLGVNRAVAITMVLFVVTASLVMLGWWVTNEVSELFAGLPDFRSNLAEKARALRGPLRSLADTMGWIDQLTREVAPPDTRAPKVEVVERPDLFGFVGRVVSPVLGPIGFAGIVAVLTVFILYQREDLRERMIRLLGSREMPFSSRAVDEAGERVSRYLGRQALLCLAHGTAVGIGLALLGLPGAGLFAVLSAGLRLIPYVGPWIAAVVPIALAVVGYPGWVMGLYVSSLFVVLELISNNLLEPWIYGPGVGLTPFGVVFSAVFWSWLWGGVGLFMAVPLTACCVVLGRYIPQLAFVTTLLGEEPSTSPEAALHERLAWRELETATAIVREEKASHDGISLSDSLILPVLARIAEERERGGCSRARSAEMAWSLGNLLDDIVPPPETPPPLRSTRKILLAGNPEDPVESLARTWLARVLREDGFAAEAVSSEAARSASAVPALATQPATTVQIALTRAAAVRSRSRARAGGPARASQDPLLLALWIGARDDRSARQPHTATSCVDLIGELETAPEARRA